MNHQGTITINTERLTLRRFRADDAPHMFKNWANDKDVCKYMRWEPHADILETEKTISDWLTLYEKNNFYLWTITLNPSNIPIGSIGLFCINENDECYEVGYCIGKNHWNNGYVSEALKSIIKFGFESVGINRIEAYHSVKNPASGKVMEKCYMAFEGFARQKFKSISGFEDSNLYSILKEDYNCL